MAELELKECHRRCAIKWFKHVSDSLDDPFIVELLDEFGAEAYLVFFGIIEIYSREFSPENQWKLDVTLPFFHRKLHTSPSKIKKILSKITKWKVEYKDNRKIPKNEEELRSINVETFQPIKNKEERIKNKENTGVFILPTIEEIKLYCIERKNSVDAQIFIDFYSAKGWMIGKNKMKDWKACVRTWEKSSTPQQKPPTPMADFTNCKKCGSRRLKSDVDLKGVCIGRCDANTTV
jgi:hypothetical protein